MTTSMGEQAVELVRSGLSKAAAARQVGLSRWGVGRACKKHGLPSGCTAAGRKAMAAVQHRPMSSAAKAACLRRAKAYRKSKSFPEPVTVLRFVDRGNTYAAAARHFGITRNQVAGYVYRARAAEVKP